MVSLLSKHNRMQTFNLLFEKSEITMIVHDHNPRNGEIRPRRFTKTVHGSLRLLAKARVDGLDDRVLDEPEIKKAIKANRLVVVKEKETKRRPRAAAAVEENTS